MTEHTPINQTNEQYVDVVARHILCALKMYDIPENAKVELEVYYNLNHQHAERLANAWVACKGDSTDCYARCLCYGNIGFQFDLTHFERIPELHYEQMSEYWINVVRYTQRSLSGLI